MECLFCASHQVQSRGTLPSGKKRYQCQSCKKWFSVSSSDEQESTIDTKHSDVTVNSGDMNFDAKIDKSKQIFVITSAQSNTPINEKFFATLKQYCDIRNAQLLIIPVLYNNPNAFVHPDDEVFDSRIVQYMTNQNIQLAKNIQILGALRINACAASPLNGLDPIAKGNSIVVGHGQIALTTLPVQPNDTPAILTTTGSMSEPSYSKSKIGYRAHHDHVLAACIVELDDAQFHIRHLSFDGIGAYDFEWYYTDTGRELSDSVEAIVFGDEHCIHIDKQVKKTTFTNKDSIVNTLKPKYMVRHDIFDAMSISHWTNKNIFVQYANYTSGMNSLKGELDHMVDYLTETTPEGAINIIVASNHNEHLIRYIQEIDIKTQPWNALIYHKLSYEMLANTKTTEYGVSYPNPLELYCLPILKERNVDTIFLKRTESFKLLDIELSYHSDKGVGGSKGSAVQYSKFPHRSIIGHAHSPKIVKGCFQTGTSSSIMLNYCEGSPTGWTHSHVILYKNGKRQLVNIINGKFRL